jgi:hypothetical protein
MLLAAWLWLAASAVHAHAPVPRRVVLTPDASAIALSLPGFGLLFRPRSDQPFSYVCDALLGLKPSDTVPSLAFLADGSLLIGSADGVRNLAPDGCPRANAGGELAAASVVAMAVRPGTPEIAYAVVSGSSAGLWRSLDGGKHWELRSKVDESELTSALVVSASNPDHVYLSVRAAAGPIVLASTDGGASLTKHAQDLALTLLSADGRALFPLWAISRDALTVGNRGLAILRAQGPAGPWQTMLRVNYFGGLVVDAAGVIWVGDEIGGLYRSDDGGDSFRNSDSDADLGCLASSGGGALWACTPGTPKEPALQKLVSGQPRTDIVAISAVDQLVSCPGLDVAKTCAAAWVEWQRDVRLLPVTSQDAGAAAPADAGQSADADAMLDAGASSAETTDAMTTESDDGDDTKDAAASLPPAPRTRSDCALTPARSATGLASQARSVPALSWLLGVLLLLRRRRRA